MYTIVKYENGTWNTISLPNDMNQGTHRGPALYADNGILYAAYESFDSAANHAFLTVAKYNAGESRWERIGNQAPPVEYGDYQLGVDDGTPYLAVTHGHYGYSEVQVARYDGTNWVKLEDPTVSPWYAIHTSFTVDKGIPYIAYTATDTFDLKRIPKTLIVKKYEGGQWISYDAYRQYYNEDGADEVQISASGGQLYRMFGVTSEGYFATHLFYIDKDGPKLTPNWPADDATDAPADTSLVMDFDEKVVKVPGKRIFLKKAFDDSIVESYRTDDPRVMQNASNPGTINVSRAGVPDLDSSTEYYVEIEPGAVTDEEGNLFAGLSGKTAWNFTTFADTEPPELTGLIPADNATGVAVGTGLSMTFNKKVQAASGKSIVIKKKLDNTVVESFAAHGSNVTVNDNTVTVRPTRELLPATEYYVQIDSEAFTSKENIAYAGIQDKTTWNFTTEPYVSAEQSTLEATPLQVAADGKTFSTVVATLKNDQGAPVAGRAVKLSADKGGSAITPAEAVTDASGRTTFKVTNGNVERITYTAKAGTKSLVQTAAVDFVAGAMSSESTVTAAPASVLADGAASSKITVKLVDSQKRPLGGKTVSLRADAGGSVITAVNTVTDSDGQAVFTVANRIAEQVNYYAKNETDGAELASYATVSFESTASVDQTPVASVVKSTLTASPAQVTANGRDASTLTVMLKDTDGRPVAGKQVSLSAKNGSAVISPNEAVTDADGRAVFSAASGAAGKVTFAARVVTDAVQLAQQADVVFESASSPAENPKPSVLRSTVEAAPAVVTADGITASTIKVTLKDINDQPVKDKTVRLRASGGSSVITPQQGISSAQGEVSFTVKNSVAEQVTYSAEDISDEIGLAQQAVVTFEAAPTPASTPKTSVTGSTVTAAPAEVAADGIAESTITVTLKDASGKGVGGKKVTVKADGGSSVIVPAEKVSDASGKATFTVKNTVAEQVVYTAKDETDNVTLSNKATVVFETKGSSTGEETSSVTQSSVEASPDQLAADGTAESTITVTLRNKYGRPVSGKTVSLAADSASSVVSPAQGVSDASGVVAFKTKNTVAEQVWYTATVVSDKATVAQRAKVAFEAVQPASTGPTTSVLHSTVTASPAQVEANGSAETTITVTLKDASGNPVAGKQVSLKASSVTASVYGGGTSNALGQVTFTAKNAVSEQVVFTATDETDHIPIAERAVVTFQAGSGAGGHGQATSVIRSAVKASPTVVTADGIMTSTITVTLLDANDIPVVGRRVNLKADGGSSVISAVYGTVGGSSVTNAVYGGLSDAQGKVYFTVKDATAEQVKYTAMDETGMTVIAEQAIVTFEAATGAGGTSITGVTQSTVTASPQTVAADGQTQSTVTVTLRDKNGQPVVGKSVSLQAEAGSSDIVAVNSASNAQGEAVFKVKSGAAGQVTYWAKDTTDNVVIAQRATVTFQLAAGSGDKPPSVLRSTVKASPDTVEANGKEQSTVTVTLLDASGGAVSGHTVSLTAVGGGAAITPVQPVSDASGKAVFTVTSLAAGQIAFAAKDETSRVSIAERANVTFKTSAYALPTSVLQSTVTADPAVVVANGTDYATVTVTLKDATGRPVSGKTVSLKASGGSSIVTIVNATSDALGQAVFKVTNRTAERVVYTAKDETGKVAIAAQAEVVFEKSRAANVTSVSASSATASPSTVWADGKQISTVTVYLKDALGRPVSGKTVSLAADGGSSVIIPVQNVSDAQGRVTFTVTNTVIEQVNYRAKDETSQIYIGQRVTVTFVDPNSTPSKPLDPNQITADPDKGEVTVKDVEPGAKVKIYNKNGDVIGEGTNPGPGKGPVTIKTNPGIQEGEVIKLTATEPGKKESDPTSVTVKKDDGTVSKPLDPNQITADPDKGEVTVKDVEPGTKVKIYDKDGNVIGEGTNPGPGKGPVTIKTVPGLNEGDVIKVTVTEPGKKESEPTNVTATKPVSKPLDPNQIAADPDKDEVTVKDVEPGTKVKIYDKDGNVIGEGTNPGPGKGPVTIKTVPGLNEGDVVKATVTEPDKKESEPVTVAIPNKPLFDIQTEWNGNGVTVKVTVTPKPGTKPAAGRAHVVFQGMRADTPVFTTSKPIDLARLEPFELKLERAQIGDRVWITIVTEPEYTRSDFGHSLSEEKADIVGGK
jgi:5-hydroxyisourate hydrolase-like protein (transthyretin family)